MNEKQTIMPETIRPTKKQRELLTFIDQFIQQHGYSPSYREIMSGLGYTSVATVSLHVRSLIKRGHLRKRDYSARSLELTHPVDSVAITTNQVNANEEKWLVGKVEHAFARAESKGDRVLQRDIDELFILLGAMQILGLETAVLSFRDRFAALKKQPVLLKN